MMMETLNDIDNMGVRELKSFIRRNGYSVTDVPRLDGTPGPAKKADLVRAAKEIVHASSKPDLSPSSPENPFQQQRRASTTTTPQRPISTSTSTTSSSAATAAKDIDHTMPVTPGRKAHVNINPQFAHLFASSNTSSSALPSPALAAPTRRTSIAPQHLPPSTPQQQQQQQQQQQTQARRVPSARPPVLPQQQQPPPPPLQQQQQQSKPNVVLPSVSGSTVVPSMPRRASIAPPSIVPSVPARDPRIAARNTRDDPRRVPDTAPPPNPTPPVPAPAPVSLRASRTVPQHPVHATVPTAPTTTTTTPKPVPASMRVDRTPAAIDVDVVDTDVVMTESDASASASEAESSGVETDGSTVETDEEENNNSNNNNSFSTWTRAQLRTWLRDQNVPYQSTADNAQLRSVAQGHKMYLESRNEVEIVVQPPRVTDEREGDVVEVQQVRRKIVTEQADEARVRRRKQAEERRNINEDDEDDEVIYVAPSARKAKRKAKAKKKRLSLLHQPSIRKVTIMTRLLAVLWALVTGIMVSSLVLAMLSLYEQATMPYCESTIISNSSSIGTAAGDDVNGSTNSISEIVVNERNEEDHCRACPTNGKCIAGKLTCLPGYTELSGRCTEDAEFSLYADFLAVEAYKLLKDIAGQAECNERQSRYLQRREISSAVHDAELKRMAKLEAKPRILKYIWVATAPSYDALKFQSAMSLALGTLTRPGADLDVSVQANSGELASNVAAITLACRVRHTIYQNIGRVLLFLALLVVGTYLRVKAFLKARYVARVDALYERAADELRQHKSDHEAGMEDHAFVKDVVLRADVVGRATDKNIRVWKDVEKRLGDDARVLRSNRTVGGVPAYVFEWAGRRRSSSIGDGLSVGSRRGSFGSRTSLDSLDMSDDGMSSSAASSIFNNNNNNNNRSPFFGRSLWGDRQ